MAENNERPELTEEQRHEREMRALDASSKGRTIDPEADDSQDIVDLYSADGQHTTATRENAQEMVEHGGYSYQRPGDIFRAAIVEDGEVLMQGSFVKTDDGKSMKPADSEIGRASPDYSETR